MNNLFGRKCTIYNQIPKSRTDSTIAAWKRFVMDSCNIQGGIQDRSTGNMQYVSGAYTVITKDVSHYLLPNFDKGGYYDEDEATHFTAAANDFIVFGEVDDPAPTNNTEFSELKKKYKSDGMVIKEAQVNIYGRPTDNITMIKT